MWAVDVAMRRSLPVQAAAILSTRDVASGVKGGLASFTEAFSSWGNCMSAVFCKWPVIALISIGGLIALSIGWCIVRRICCGIACCCECMQCLKCCGDCCGCCDAPKGRHKYLDDSYIPASSRDGYRPPLPMTVPAHVSAPAPTQTASVPSQFAHFDLKKDDALPAMPSWNTSSNVHAEEHVEMDRLIKPQASVQSLPLMSGAVLSPNPISTPLSTADAFLPNQRQPISRQPAPGRPEYASRPADGFLEFYPYPQVNPHGDLDVNYHPSPYSEPDQAYGGRDPYSNQSQFGARRQYDPRSLHDGRSPSDGRGPRDGRSSRDGRSPYDGRSPREGRSPYDAGILYDSPVASDRRPSMATARPTLNAGYALSPGPPPRPTPPHYSSLLPRSPVDYPSLRPSYQNDQSPNDSPYTQLQLQPEPTPEPTPMPPLRPWPPSQYPSSLIHNNSGFDFNSGYSRPNTSGRDHPGHLNKEPPIVEYA